MYANKSMEVGLPLAAVTIRASPEETITGSGKERDHERAAYPVCSNKERENTSIL
jgi:hypothetical protein